MRIHTRTPLLWLSLTLALTGCASSQPADKTTMTTPYPLVASGYTDKGGQGIYSLTYNPQTASFEAPRLIASASNPSIGLQNNQLWYFVAENAQGQLLTYKAAPSGSWSLLQTTSSAGASPCHIALRQDRAYLSVANYMGGNLAIFALDAQGLPKGEPQVLQHSGRGPSARQEAAHAHFSAFATDAQGQNGLYAVDLGVDKVFWYPETRPGHWGPGTLAWQAQPGDGPRHLSLHPRLKRVYILNELSNTLVVAEPQPGGPLKVLQRLSTLPADFSGENTAAHIQISADGRFLYTSNRGHHSIAVFALDDQGAATLQQIQPSGGQWPRHFTLLDDAQTLLVAHQNSNDLVALRVSPQGLLAATGARVSIPSPTFVQWQKPAP